MAEGPYNPRVMDHFTHPRNMGEIDAPDGVGEATNPVCGDTLRLFLKVSDDRIVDVRFLTFGCAAAIAASSITTEMIRGKTLDEVLEISDRDVFYRSHICRQRIDHHFLPHDG